MRKSQLFRNLTSEEIGTYMERRWSTTRRVGIGLIASVLAATGWQFIDAPARSGSSTVPTGFYLDIGGSSSLGYEPTGLLTKDGALLDKPSDNGYANDVVKLEASTMSLSLAKIGCPAETVVTLMGEKDQCYTWPTTQMSTAMAYLRSHQNETGLVSIDIGFNDIRPCLATAAVEAQCAEEARESVASGLPRIVAKLQSAAGSEVDFVGLEYEDPFLSRYLLGSDEKTYVNQTLQEITELNHELSAAYTNAGVAVADSPAMFSSASTTPTKMANGDVVPKNVAVVCADTYMCRAYPYGPDDHPNNAGYEVIAKEIVSHLPTTW